MSAAPPDHNGRQERPEPVITLTSFGFKYGPPPPDCTLVVDVRFLQNPFWDAALKDKSGLDEAVGAYIAEDPAFAGFMEYFEKTVWPALARGDKEEIRIGIGCTGGRHRSVYTAETLARALKNKGLNAGVTHRDLEK